MDDMFREFFHKEPIDFKKLSSDTLVIFDTNTLLNIYRYSNDTRNSLIKVMKEIKENIWIPNQVMLEFSLNRQETLAKLIKEKDDIPIETSQKYLNFYRTIETFINEIKIKSIDASSMKKELLANFKNSLDILEKEFSEQVHSILSIVDLTEDLAGEFKDLFTGRIGNSFGQERLDEIATSATERFKYKVPPAYKDDGKSEIVSYNGVIYEKKYGDLIIWNQILDKAKDEKIKKIVFVTDDNKPDWWFKVQGKTIGPRAELKNELLRISRADLYMLNSNSFLKQYTHNQSNLIVEEIESKVTTNLSWKKWTNDFFYEVDEALSESDIKSLINELNKDIKHHEMSLKSVEEKIQKGNETIFNLKNSIEDAEDQSLISRFKELLDFEEDYKAFNEKKLRETLDELDFEYQEHYHLTMQLQRKLLDK